MARKSSSLLPMLALGLLCNLYMVLYALSVQVAQTTAPTPPLAALPNEACSMPKWNIRPDAFVKEVRDNRFVIYIKKSDCLPCKFLMTHLDAIGLKGQIVLVEKSPIAAHKLVEYFGHTVKLPVIDREGLNIYGYSPKRLENFLSKFDIGKR